MTQTTKGAEFMHDRQRNRRRLVTRCALTGLVLGGMSIPSASATTPPTGSAASPSGDTVPAALQPKFTPVSGPVRGFDGTTIKVAGMGIKARLPGSELGAMARIKRFNDTNEIPGIKIEYTEMVDDKGDPAISLTESRRLVESVGIFAIVGDVSQSNPTYLAEQHVPYFGWAFDNTYCSPTGEPSTDIWGFGYYGCLVDDNPRVLPNNGGAFYEVVSKSSGKTNPTEAIISTDSDSGKRSVRNFEIADTGAGFKVVLADTSVPQTPVSDWTPYVQKLMTSADGGAPDAIRCGMAVECVPLWQGLQAAGYQGEYLHFLYTDFFVGPLAGTTAAINFAPFDTDNAAVNQLKADVKAVKADGILDTGVTTGYFSTDMLITAVKVAMANGGISPENVQQAAATMTWGIDGLVGPTAYPASSVKPSPLCTALAKSDGTKWTTVHPLTCSDKVFEVK